MRRIPNTDKFTVAEDVNFYLSQAGVVWTPEGFVCIFRKGDEHCVTDSSIMITRSKDGKNWSPPEVISRRSVEKDHSVWVSPQISRLRSGELIILCDLGNRKLGEPHLNLHAWQKSDRGMSNYFFRSVDNGKTWTSPEKIDDVGGEPSYICELSNGDLLYTRTESLDRSDEQRFAKDDIDHGANSINPNRWRQGYLSPHGYYRNVCVASEDNGETWGVRSILADSPTFSDAEVGPIETAPGRIVAVTRSGNMGGYSGQPSRIFKSSDNGKSWEPPKLAPFYGQRVITRKLQSGKLLSTFRNFWGTVGSCALVWDPDENLKYEPSLYIWDESCCEIGNQGLTIRSREGNGGAVDYCLFPAEDEKCEVECSFELRLEEADLDGVAVSAGVWIRFERGRISLSQDPAIGLDFDTTSFHRYEALRKNGELHLRIDGKEKLVHRLGALANRYVHFGNRNKKEEGPDYKSVWYTRNEAVSHWKSFAARVENRTDHVVHWDWDFKSGYPDPFRRERIVGLDFHETHHANSGYSGWAQSPDGTIVIVDYTVGYPSKPKPFIRAYVTSENRLNGKGVPVP